VFYEDLVGQEWKVAINEVADFLGHPFTERYPEYEKELEAFIDRKLQHHKSSIVETLYKDDVPFAVKYFYCILMSVVKFGKVEWLNQLGSSPDEILNNVASHAHVEALRMHRQNSRLVDCDHKVEVISDLIKERDTRLAEVAVWIEDYEMRVGHLTKLREEQNMRIEDLTQRNEDLTKLREDQNMRIEDLTQRIEDLLTSNSWRITAPLRRAYTVLNRMRRGTK